MNYPPTALKPELHNRNGHDKATRTTYLSFLGHDSASADQVATELKRRGFQSSLCDDEPHSGAEIELSDCGTMVVLLSNQAFAHAWADQRDEIISAGRQRANRPLRIVPVRLDDCEVPSLPVGADGEQLTDLHRIDLFPDFDRGIDQLATALRL